MKLVLTMRHFVCYYATFSVVLFVYLCLVGRSLDELRIGICPFCRGYSIIYNQHTPEHKEKCPQGGSVLVHAASRLLPPFFFVFFSFFEESCCFSPQGKRKKKECKSIIFF